MKRTSVAVATVAALALAAGTVAVSQAKESGRINAELSSNAQTTLTKTERRAVSIAAGRLLRHASDARRAIAEGKVGKAMGEIEKGQKLAGMIDGVLPTYVVKAKITAGKTVYEDQDTEKMRIVPVFDEADRYSLVAPLEKVGNGVKKDKGTSDMPVIFSSGTETLRLSLDIGNAKTGLDRAHKALKDEKPEVADRALALVQDSVFLTTVVEETPIDTARADLMEAKLSAEQGDLKEAHAALDEVVGILDTFAKSASSDQASEAQSVRNKAQTLASSIETSPKGKADAIGKLWDQLGKVSQL